MEKKGELLNQLAVISDLLERTNINSQSVVVTFSLDNDEFKKVISEVQKKYGKKLEEIENTFTLSIGLIDIVFNTNNV